MARKQDLLAVGEHASATRVYRQRADDEALRRHRLMTAADEGSKARRQLANVVGLDEIVVRAGIEPVDARLDRIARGQHEDRHLAAGIANRPAHGQAVDRRQHHVEDHAVVVVGRDLEDRGFAIAGDVDRVGLLAQSLGQHVRSVRFVFDQQNPHRVTCPP